MSYHDIILQNRNLCPVSWWPNYAYHFTDVNNAVSILKYGHIYSRINAEEKRLMVNDNASRQVIDMTGSGAADHVRFYFRPLTPTQYHNEGYKHPDVRYDRDPHANVPVPVFFFFDLESLLMDSRTMFSPSSEAGRGAPMLSGEKDFAALDFQRIYADGPYGSADPGDRKRETALRQAEILYPSAYPVFESLSGIACRNETERETFLNLVRDQSQKTYLQILPKVKVLKEKVFYGNGLYVEDCLFHDGVFAVVLSEYYKRRQFVAARLGDHETGSLSPIKCTAVFEWTRDSKIQREIIFQKNIGFEIDYLRREPIRFVSVPDIPNARTLIFRLYFEDSLMCYRKFSLSEGEVV